MEELIRKTLFSEHKNLSSKTILHLDELELLPNCHFKTSVRNWKKSYIGHFLSKYPKRSGELNMLMFILKGEPKIEDFTQEVLEELVKMFKVKAPGTAKAYASRVKTVIAEMLEEDPDLRIPCRTYKKILSLPDSPSTKPFLNMNDVKAILGYIPKTETERICHALFIISIMTGARISDAKSFSRENIINGVLSYVPQKTKSSGTVVNIPVSETTAKFIDIVSGKKTPSMFTYTNNIRKICKECGLTEEVKYFYGGKYVVKEKWQAMRSHLGRVSFVTLMLEMGQQIQDVSKMAGHTDINMTARYNASTEVKLNEKASAFINMDFED